MESSKHTPPKINYIRGMKRRTIWLTAVLMFVSIFALIVTEVYYYHQIQDMRRRQFEENVQRALYQTAHALEIKEVQDRLDAEMGDRKSVV